MHRAEEVNRTPDLLITNQLLYQLSYFGYFFFYTMQREVFRQASGWSLFFWKKSKVLVDLVPEFSYN